MSSPENPNGGGFEWQMILLLVLLVFGLFSNYGDDKAGPEIDQKIYDATQDSIGVFRFRLAHALENDVLPHVGDYKSSDEFQDALASAYAFAEQVVETHVDSTNPLDMGYDQPIGVMLSKAGIGAETSDGDDRYSSETAQRCLRSIVQSLRDKQIPLPADMTVN